MGIKERKMKEKANLRDKILTAVNELITSGGFEELSMRKIAEKIEYSPSTIYRFFKNKDELLGVITDSTYKDLSKKFNKLKPEETKDSLEMLKMLIHEYIKFSLDRPNIYRIYVHLCKLKVSNNLMYEEIGENSYRIFTSWQNRIEDLIKAGRLKLTSSISLVLLIWHTTDGFILNRLNQPALPWGQDEEEISRLIDMIFYGILK